VVSAYPIILCRAVQGAEVRISFLPTKLKDIKDFKYSGISAKLVKSNPDKIVYVSSHEGIEHQWDYEGDAALTSAFIVSGTQYTFTFNGETYSDKRDSILYPIYKQMLKTAKF